LESPKATMTVMTRSIRPRAVSRLCRRDGQRRPSSRPASGFWHYETVLGAPLSRQRPLANGKGSQIQEPALKPAAVLLAAVVVAGVASAAAAPRLRPIMRDWKAQAGRAELLLTGAVPYDEAELRRILTAMVGDARDVEAGISGASAQALDAKSRFSQFEADAAATLQSAGARDGARARFQRVAGDCRSCHDALRD
jgi:cytochrome c556